LIRTPVGFALSPIKDGEVLSTEEFENLPKEKQKQRQKAMGVLEKELAESLQKIPKWAKDQRRMIRDLNRDVTEFAVGHLIDELKRDWQDVPAVLDHLEAVRKDVIEHAAAFLSHNNPGAETMLFSAQQSPSGGPDIFHHYKINVLVDNGPSEGGSEKDRPPGAPVIYEDHPTLPNLIGRIEHQSQFGTLVTDFNLIKAGALHRANGGYLILDARKLLLQPFSWEMILRALRSGRARIESPAESLGWVSTVTLEPEPVPLSVKVILLGEPRLYYLLCWLEPEFRELFKVSADFDNRMDRNGDNAFQYVRLIATLASQMGLRPLHKNAVARVVEQGARLADDAEKLTTHMGAIVDLVREADFWAGKGDSELVQADHVQKAIDAKIYRSDRLREHIQEEIQRGTLLIEVEGEKIGQVNGLSVIQLDTFAFGRPSRISCSIRMGKGDVVDIEREVALGGALHSKGVMILSSYLGNRYARKQPLSLTASLVFEQSYGGVEGDSASSAELYALLSALAEIPLKQSLAVTGSVDQLGRVQAIGGVNDKIEGFFDICKILGLTGEQGVLIPASNVKHLMLRADVVEAVASGKFKVYGVETIDQGMEILTGIPAGVADKKGEYPIGSVNRAVTLEVAALARQARAFAAKAAPEPGIGSSGLAR